MAEYIKREALVDLVLGKLRFMGDARIMNKGDEKVLSEINGYEKAIYAVHELLLDKDLIEDIQPVKHGRWKPAKNGDEDYLYLSTILGIPVEDLPKYAYCSECKFSFATNGVDKTGKALIHKAVYKYCPNCGARMDGDNNA